MSNINIKFITLISKWAKMRSVILKIVFAPHFHQLEKSFRILKHPFAFEYLEKHSNLLISNEIIKFKLYLQLYLWLIHKWQSTCESQWYTVRLASFWLVEPNGDSQTHSQTFAMMPYGDCMKFLVFKISFIKPKDENILITRFDHTTSSNENLTITIVAFVFGIAITIIVFAIGLSMFTIRCIE